MRRAGVSYGFVGSRLIIRHRWRDWRRAVREAPGRCVDRRGLVRAAGLVPVARHSTWDGEPWRNDADWCVSVDRAPA